MPRQQLQDALRALREELSAGAELESEDREALLRAAQEIQAALGRDPDAASVEGGPLSSRISELIGDFETSHPRLAVILNKVSEALANLGI